MIQKVLDELV